MPFFVVSRPLAPPPVPDTSTNQFVLLGGASSQHETREAAEQEAERLRAAQSDRTHDVIEAATADEALFALPPGAAPSPLEIEIVGTWNQMEEALRIRYRVFVMEQGVSEVDEIDEYDLPKAWGQTSLQVLGYTATPPMAVATGRVLLDAYPGELAHIGRVAVLPWLRRHGYGRVIMRALEEEARQRGFPGILLHAQLHAVPFYEALGYAAHGPAFIEAGIEHRAMELRWA